MLDKQMCGAYLAFRRPTASLRLQLRERIGGGGVVYGHVRFYFLRVGAGGWFPAGFLGGGIEVIGEVLRIGVADFP